jgi:hypothetical protein
MLPARRELWQGCKAGEVSSSLSEPSLRFLLPASNENRWTDLLASFIETDPQPLAKLLNLAGPYGVQREVSISRDDYREDGSTFFSPAARTAPP